MCYPYSHYNFARKVRFCLHVSIVVKPLCVFSSVHRIKLTINNSFKNRLGVRPAMYKYLRPKVHPFVCHDPFNL